MGILQYIPRLTIPARQKSVQPRRMMGLERAYAQSMGDYFASLVGEGSADFAPSEYGKYYFTNTWVYRAVKLRADSVAAAKFRIYRETADGEEPVEATHPVQELMDRVNPLYSAADLWRTTETHLGIWGSSLWFLDRQGETGPEIWPLRPDRVKAIRRAGQSKLTSYLAGYEFTAPGGERVAIPLEEAVWFRYINPLSELDGVSPVGPVRLTVDMGHDAIQYNRSGFTNGLQISNLAFTVDGVLPEDEYEDFMRRLEARYKGKGGFQKPFLATNGADVKNLGLSAKDMEYNENLNFTVEDVARAYGIWPELLASGTRAAFRNTPEAVADFWMSTVSSEWTFLETEVTEVLLPLFGASAQGLVAMFDPTGIPALERARAAESRLDLDAVKLGAITINEWRAEKGMDPVEWGDEPIKPVDPFGGFGAEPEDEDDAPPPDDEESAKPLKETAPALRRFNRVMSQHKEKMLTEKALDFTYKSLAARERSFRSMMSNLFDEQKASSLNKLRTVQANGGIGDVFVPDDWQAKFDKRGRPMIEDAVTQAAKEQARLFRLRPNKVAIAQGKGFNPFDRSDPGFIQWVTSRVKWWADRTNEETARLLTEELTEGRRLGESLNQLQTRIENVFNFNDAIRSERIARTESVASTNRGHLELYKTSGVVQRKRWLTARDSRVRDSHYEVERAGPIDVDDLFIVGEDQMEAPGQGNVAGEVINCRCVCLPVVER